MAAVVRIKRRLDEDPLESFVLNCKKRKPNGAQSEDTEELSAVLKLAGTTKEDENIESVLKKHRVADKAGLKDQFKSHAVNINEKLRSNLRESSKSSRYRVVNCFRRTLNSDETSSEDANTSEVTVFDIETDSNENKIENTEESTNRSENKSNFVYDFYYTSSDDFGEADIQDYVSVYPLNDPLIFGSTRDNGLDELDSDDESEDSNAENNWKNDYPDEEDLESINEDDMIEAVKNLNIEEDLLSSDSGEEDLVYSRDEEDFQTSGLEVEREDELRYGKLYAKFKAKNKKIESTSLANELYYGDIDEEEYYY